MWGMVPLDSRRDEDAMMTVLGGSLCMSQTPYRDMDADRQILRVIIFATCFEQSNFACPK